MKFYGRKDELNELEMKWATSKSELIVVYGRRRIGKSKLIEEFCRNKPALSFEGLEGKKTQAQIRHFQAILQKQVPDRGLQQQKFIGWDAAFSYLTQWLAKQAGNRTVIFFDEFQWMAASRTHLVSLLKYYWDNEWKNYPVLVILCGSIATFMIEKVIHSSALYGRISLELPIRGLNPYESSKMFQGKRSLEEILKYLMIFGGVPKYLEEIQLNRSFEQNINRLCFSKNGLMTNEFERIFYNQFTETSHYEDIVRSLQAVPLSFDQIAKKIKLPSGGGLKRYLTRLEQADFIKSIVPLGQKSTSKLKKYRLSDEYLIFYFKYILPQMKWIQEGISKNIFEKLVMPQWQPWLGFAFERFCLKNASHLAQVMGFSEQVLGAAPYYTHKDQGFQIDLVYQRADRVYTICEIKYYNKPITTTIIPEVERKTMLFPCPNGYSIEKALISLYGPDRALKESKYFDHSVTLKDLFSEG